MWDASVIQTYVNNVIISSIKDLRIFKTGKKVQYISEDGLIQINIVE